MKGLIIVLVVVVVILAILYFLFPRILICGNSMSPTYISEEILWATRLFKRKNLKVGDVVVVRFRAVEDNRHRTVIKRITMVKPESKRIFIEGDNAPESYDSREYGFIPQRLVIAKLFDQREKEVCNEERVEN